jgi:glycosyltransferase involved in cell wall biosynthesis
MAWGKPVIGSRVGGIPELVRDGHEGVLVAHGDAGALGEAMLALQNDSDRSQRMGRAGRERVMERYDAGLHYSAVAEAYARAADIRKAAR